MLFAHVQFKNWFLGSQIVLGMIVLVYLANWRTFLGAITLARLRPDRYPIWKWSSSYPDLVEQEIP